MHPFDQIMLYHHPLPETVIKLAFTFSHSVNEGNMLRNNAVCKQRGVFTDELTHTSRTTIAGRFVSLLVHMTTQAITECGAISVQLHSGDHSYQEVLGNSVSSKKLST